MNWGLILQLSVFGLAMAIATVFWISSAVEPFFWFGIFVVCAYVIALQASRRYFLHGLLVSVVNSVWITTAHIALFDQYIARHPQEAAMLSESSMPGRVLMAMMGPVIGVLSGIVLGLFAVGASKLVRPAGRR